MKTIFLTIITLTINFLSYSQAQIPAAMSSSIYLLNLGEETKVSSVTLNDPVSVGFSDDFETIEGGPYYKNEWLKGRVILKNGQVLGNEWLFKYNTFQDELHVRLESGEVKIPTKNQIRAFMIEQDGQQHYFVNSAQTGMIEQEDNTFFEVLHSEKFTLLKKSSKQYGELESDEFYCSTCKNPPTVFFFVSEKYYIKDKKGQFKNLKFNKKSLLNAFPKEQHTLITSSWKKNKFRLKTERGLLALLQDLEN